tara:strand:- start:281 stop:469 length:189 start_codon:yes stop_codon:yes gene_type:complete
MKHAAKLFPIALQELIAIGDKARKQREQGERAKQASKASFTRACKNVACREKQLKLQLQTRI